MASFSFCRQRVESCSVSCNSWNSCDIGGGVSGLDETCPDTPHYWLQTGIFCFLCPKGFPLLLLLLGQAHGHHLLPTHPALDLGIAPSTFSICRAVFLVEVVTAKQRRPTIRGRRLLAAANFISWRGTVTFIFFFFLIFSGHRGPASSGPQFSWILRQVDGGGYGNRWRPSGG